MKTKQVERKGTYLRAFRAAFPCTVPVLTGYLFIGMAFGVMIQDNRYFCVGDHRSTSVDSRSTAVGCISDEQIVGRIVFRVWPLPDFGALR